jgi:N-(2-amino-2-carboxyethyl)-L-glutamate synthase
MSNMSHSQFKTKHFSSTKSVAYAIPKINRVQSPLLDRVDVSPQVNIPAVNSGILSIIGNTPLVKLENVFPEAKFQLFAKLEMFNPGGSIKDRPALNMLKNAFERGEIRPGSTIIESSSGNLGIGLAQACILLGLRFICVIDPKTTQQNLNILKAYGAEISLLVFLIAIGVISMPTLVMLMPIFRRCVKLLQLLMVNLTTYSALLVAVVLFVAVWNI